MSLIPKSLPGDQHRSADLFGSPLIVRSFTCIPEFQYCSAERIGVRHDCETAKRQAWIHDPGDEA